MPGRARVDRRPAGGRSSSAVKHVERIEQTKLAALVRQLRPHLKFTAIPLGEHRDKRTAAILFNMGVSKGWPDLFFPQLRLWIEMKKEGEKPDKHQREIISMLESCGYSVAVVFSALEGYELLRTWPTPKSLTP